jgi:formylglycine-generating enzyme required for sulfatase activity
MAFRLDSGKGQRGSIWKAKERNMPQRSSLPTTMMVAGLVVACASGASASIVIDTVPVGNAGNAGDTRYPDTYDGVYSFGSVGYTYNMGTYEVTAGQYTAFLNAVAGVDTYALYNTGMSNTSYGSGITRSGGGTLGNPYIYSVASSFTNRPVNNVSWGDSARFANWLHNGQPSGSEGLATTEDGSYYLNGATSDAALLAVTRKPDATWAIPTEDEWYKAAYYKGGSTNAGYWDYPTSSDTAPGQDMADVSGNNANFYNGIGPWPIDSPYYTTVVGEFQNSASPYGTFDQGGNVWEWNEAVLFGSNRGLRGSSFGNDDYALRASYRDDYYPTGEDNFAGFRVAEVPEPSSLAMLLFAGLFVLSGRKNSRQ